MSLKRACELVFLAGRPLAFELHFFRAAQLLSVKISPKRINSAIFISSHIFPVYAASHKKWARNGFTTNSIYKMRFNLCALSYFLGGYLLCWNYHLKCIPFSPFSVCRTSQFAQRCRAEWKKPSRFHGIGQANRYYSRIKWKSIDLTIKFTTGTCK